ncbi:hydantoinase/oxoprolinase family protein [Anderseniella sp. Alg231-50]|uniref:hydantoinase/oxoprolinase family protein n=1 Tax=Anderseniella sp. Alg231-50 TaxID=1922226 RepID=UPI00307BBBDA
MTGSTKSYLIGVDTGGTYTDAAVVDAATSEVLASAKALTTRGDLAVGVCEAIERALSALGGDAGAASGVKLVSVSTTLATNAVVEGHGSPVCVVLVGFDETMVQRSGLSSAFPGLVVECIAGGHDHNGGEVTRLDMDALAGVVEKHGHAVEAFAVASQFAVRNPAHELAARDFITGKTLLPVTVSTELASALDAPRRALTAALNARLISRISLLIKAVQQAMERFGIDAPLMMTKGDGSLARAETVALRPIETVLSGPAASLVGAATLSGLSDFILSDMGGTTTDLGVLENGRPQVNEQGADVGGWRTMVQAIDVRTLGLGGDSEVGFDMKGIASVGARRSVPVSLVASKFPHVIQQLQEDISDAESGSTAGQFVMLPLGRVESDANHAGLSRREQELLASITTEPLPLRKLAAGSGAHRTLETLSRKGHVQLAGFTPSDAAHVLGLQDNWSRDAAVLAARLLVRNVLQKAPSDELVTLLSQGVWEETVRLAGRAVLETALGHHAIEPGGAGGLIDVVCRGEGKRSLARVSISPQVPVVAVGGPVKIYYPEVGKRLGCEMVFPQSCEVANAVGAATGMIARTVTIEVNGNGAGVFRVHGPQNVSQFASANEAIDEANRLARETAAAEVNAMGGGQVSFAEDIEKFLLPDAVDDNGLLRATVKIEATARPALSL